MIITPDDGPVDAPIVDCVVADDWCYWGYNVTYGIGTTIVGTWHRDITLRIFGRDVNWYQTSDVTAGPAIKARHEFNCVDNNGALPNTSCTGGWQRRWNSVYTAAKWTWPNPDIRFVYCSPLRNGRPRSSGADPPRPMMTHATIARRKGIMRSSGGETDLPKTA